MQSFVVEESLYLFTAENAESAEMKKKDWTGSRRALSVLLSRDETG